MKEPMDLDEFEERFRNAYYDALAYKKDVVVDGYTFFRKWYVLNHFLDHEASFPGTYTVGMEVDSLFADDSYANTFYEVYLEWVNDDNEIEKIENELIDYDKILEQNELEQIETGKDDL